jgi:Rrf2 family iron-sulfur cluster assembly transcriptional regulator
MTCLTHDLWSELSHEIDLFLRGVTLAKLVDQRRVQTVAMRQDRLLKELADDRRIAARHV